MVLRYDLVCEHNIVVGTLRVPTTMHRYNSNLTLSKTQQPTIYKTK